MKLIELNPKWIGHGGEGVYDKDNNPIPYSEKVGIDMDCPCGKCGRRLFVPFKRSLDGTFAQSNGWDAAGTDFNNLTLKPSIQRMQDCKWHGFITNGEIITV